MGALSNRLEAKRNADHSDAAPLTWPHRAVAAALYSAIHGTAAERVSVAIEWPGVGMYQAVVYFTFGTATVSVQRGSIENSPYRATVKLVDRLIREYQAQAPGQ